jgi:hypothetical protein
MLHRDRVLILALALLPALRAQNLCVTVSPNPAPQGVPVTVSGYAKSPGLYTPTACWVPVMRAGTPTGQVLFALPCAYVATAIPPCGSTTAPRSFTWNQNAFGSQAAPGDYWFEIDTTTSPVGPVSTEWHCVTIVGATPRPTLSTPGNATWGSPFGLGLAAPGHAGEFYAVALSGTTNTGLALNPNLFLCLDTDAIFNLTFPSPDPTTFVNFQGNLDAQGNAAGITILIPPLNLGCFPLHAQAGLIGTSGAITLSNEIAFTIQ